MISNAEYLILLNFAAGRSFNDATQYPVFPWVITDYKNATFPEEKHTTQWGGNQRGWRDLSKPIGTIAPEKLDKFRSKYFQLVSKSPNSSPFLKGVVTNDQNHEQDEVEPSE